MKYFFKKRHGHNIRKYNWIFLDVACFTYDIDNAYPDFYRIGISSITYSNGTLSNTYSCGLHHGIKGPETITCYNGKWSAAPPSCTRITVYQPPQISGKKIDVVDVETTTFNNQESEDEIYDTTVLNNV